MRWQRWGLAGLSLTALIVVGQMNFEYQDTPATPSGPTAVLGGEVDSATAVSSNEPSTKTAPPEIKAPGLIPTPTVSSDVLPSNPHAPPQSISPTDSPGPMRLFALPTETFDPLAAEPEEPAPAAAAEPPTLKVGGEESELVTKVIDGDTIELESGERVRYIGIDTPESTTYTECYGKAAADRNRELVEGKRVRLELDVEHHDRYGRTLAYVYLPASSAGVGETFVNETLVAEGFASTLTIPPNVRFADRFAELAAAAREQGQGLWSACGGNGSSSNTPSRPGYDETIPQASTSDCPADQPIKGNAQSQIYHVPGGDFYDKTKPEACFSTEGEAATAGYRRSKR